MQRGCCNTVAIWRKASAPSRSCATEWRLAPPANATAKITARPRCTRNGSALPGCEMNRLADALIRAAAADVGDGGIDVTVARMRLLAKQRCRRHDHPA